MSSQTQQWRTFCVHFPVLHRIIAFVSRLQNHCDHVFGFFNTCKPCCILWISPHHPLIDTMCFYTISLFADVIHVSLPLPPMSTCPLLIMWPVTPCLSWWCNSSSVFIQHRLNSGCSTPPIISCLTSFNEAAMFLADNALFSLGKRIRPPTNVAIHFVTQKYFNVL